METTKSDAVILDNSEVFKNEKEEVQAVAAKKALTVPAAEQTVFQQMLANAKDIEIDKLKQLQDMYEHAQDREAERLFSEDFAKMQPELPRVIRTKDNTQTKSKYSPLEDINKQINPILQKYGFGISAYTLEQNESGVKVRVVLRHRAGHKEETIVFMPLDNKGMAGTVNKTMPHAHSSSIMYCRRVGTCMLLNISTGDDTDGNLPDTPINEEMAELVKEKIKEFEPEYSAKLLKYMKADCIENIPVNHTAKLLKALEAKKKLFDEEKAKKVPNDDK